MPEASLTAEQSAQLKTVLTRLNAKAGAATQAKVESTPCDIYKKDIKPDLDLALPYIKLIPVYGSEIASAIEFLEKIADQLCK